MPRKPYLLSKSLREFFQTESASGVVMLLATVVAMLWVNAAEQRSYENLQQAPVSINLLNMLVGSMPLKALVNDVLMVLFFFVVGMELKKEMLTGFLARRDQKVLPLMAATGGMAMPAAVYLLFNHSYPAQAHGWAIPAATDIAFAVGVLSLAGRHIPPAAKVFLLAVAIYDDLGAILIIALFYSSKLHLLWLGMAAAVAGILFLCNRFRLGATVPYIALMFLLVWLLHHGGIHSTIAGVITGLAVPLQRDGNDFHSPLHRMLHAFHPWVAFGILPLFALLNAGIPLHGMTLHSLEQPITAGTALGLILGKPLGILLMVGLAVGLRLSPLPENTSWRTLGGIACLAGIGFTMSLFIQALAFPHSLLHQQEAKTGILAGSVIAALMGMLMLRWGRPKTIPVTVP